MLKNLLVKLGIVSIFLALGLASGACSAFPAPLPTAFATPTPVATDAPTPAPTTAAQKNPGKSNPAHQNPANVPAEFRNLGLEGGVVTANNGTQLSLKLGRSQDQLLIASNPIIIKPGLTNAGLSDVQVGDRIIANVPANQANAVATLLLDFPKGYTADNVALGVVQSNTNGSLQVKARKGNEQITTDSSTFIGLIQDKPTMGTVSDVKRGNAVLVIGKPDGDSLSAQVIVVVDRSALQSQRNKNTPSPTPTP